MNDLLTVREVAEILRVREATVIRWVKRGVLRAVHLPHIRKRQVFRIKRQELDAILHSDLLPV